MKKLPLLIISVLLSAVLFSACVDDRSAGGGNATGNSSPDATTVITSADGMSGSPTGATGQPGVTAEPTVEAQSPAPIETTDLDAESQQAIDDLNEALKELDEAVEDANSIIDELDKLE